MKDYFSSVVSVLRHRGGHVLPANHPLQLGHVGLQRPPPLVLPPVPWRYNRDPFDANGEIR